MIRQDPLVEKMEMDVEEAIQRYKDAWGYAAKHDSLVRRLFGTCAQSATKKAAERNLRAYPYPTMFDG
jgi:hypothetical protein